jgi:hypothetical protein
LGKAMQRLSPSSGWQNVDRTAGRLRTFRRVGLGLMAAISAITMSTPAAQAATGGTVCTGVRGCKVMGKVDVDGDHRTDQVGIVRVGTTEKGKVTVRVRTARGRTLQTSNALNFWTPGSAWFGAAAVDGRPGAEIVVGSSAGLHTEYFRVVTYRAGRLVTLKAPPRLPGSSSRWVMDCSYSENIGVSRRVAKGTTYITVRTALRNASGEGHHGRTTVYKWRSDRWVQISTKTVRYRSDQSAFSGCGWRVKGLHRYA